PGLWAWSTSSRQGFPARTSQMQATERVLRVSAQESGRTSVKQLGYFSPDSSSWKTWQQSAEGDSPLSPKTWPKSGMTCSGRLYELPMPDSRITVTGGSDSQYLPTPKGGPNMRNSKGEYDALPSAVVHLLPTPTARDWKSGASNLHGKNARPLSEVALLFPTPTASDGGGGAGTSPNRKGGMNLRTAVNELPEDDGLVQDWVEYEPAIRRQEALVGRQAPIPTELGPRGGRRLTAGFAEWLMGLPDGWVTDVPDLVSPKRDPRSKQLKAIGNGVVPQQAYAAFSHLLSQVALMKEVSIEGTDVGH